MLNTASSSSGLSCTGSVAEASDVRQRYPPSDPGVIRFMLLTRVSNENGLLNEALGPLDSQVNVMS